MTSPVLPGLLLATLLGGAQSQPPSPALPPGEYAWTVEMRCETEALCVAAYGQAVLPPWMESFTFIGHLTSNGQTMTYTGANVFRGRSGAGPAGICDAPFEKPFSGQCIFGEKAEAFLKATTFPGAILKNKRTIWAKNSLLYRPVAGGRNQVTPCPCGPEGSETPTPETVGTLTTKDFFDGKEPRGVTMTVQLVKLP